MTHSGRLLEHVMSSSTGMLALGDLVETGLACGINMATLISTLSLLVSFWCRIYKLSSWLLEAETS